VTASDQTTFETMPNLPNGGKLCPLCLGPGPLTKEDIIPQWARRRVAHLVTGQGKRYEAAPLLGPMMHGKATVLTANHQTMRLRGSLSLLAS